MPPDPPVCWIDRAGQGGSRFRRRFGLGFWRRVGPVHPPKLAFLNKAVTGTSWGLRDSLDPQAAADTAGAPTV